MNDLEDIDIPFLHPFDISLNMQTVNLYLIIFKFLSRKKIEEFNFIFFLKKKIGKNSRRAKTRD